LRGSIGWLRLAARSSSERSSRRATAANVWLFLLDDYNIDTARLVERAPVVGSRRRASGTHSGPPRNFSAARGFHVTGDHGRDQPRRRHGRPGAEVMTFSCLRRRRSATRRGRHAARCRGAGLFLQPRSRIDEIVSRPRRWSRNKAPPATSHCVTLQINQRPKSAAACSAAASASN